jgi:hypothetical protein
VKRVEASDGASWALIGHARTRLLEICGKARGGRLQAGSGRQLTAFAPARIPPIRRFLLPRLLHCRRDDARWLVVDIAGDARLLTTRAEARQVTCGRAERHHRHDVGPNGQRDRDSESAPLDQRSYR